MLPADKLRGRLDAKGQKIARQAGQRAALYGGRTYLLIAKHAKQLAESRNFFAEQGPHGFGLKPGYGPTSDWPKRCEEWLRFRGLLEKR